MEQSLPVIVRSRVVQAYEKRPWVFHLLFWTMYFVVMNTLLTQFFGSGRIVLRNILVLGIHMVLVYVTTFVILPKTLGKGWLFAFLGLEAILVAILAPIQATITAKLLKGTITGEELYSNGHYAGIILTMVLFIAISSAMKMLQNDLHRIQEAQTLQNAKLEAELRFLQTQVNPHFLFNALNSIYTLSYTQNEAAAPAILKLSELMRYMLESSRQADGEGSDAETLRKIDLAKEIEYLRNYIELEALKSPDSLKVSFEVKGAVDRVKLEPMLFIPFFENAYKHGNIAQGGWIKAILEVIEGNGKNSSGQEKGTFKVKLSMENSYSGVEGKKDEVSGIGLANLTERLKLLYPGEHSLRTQTSKNEQGESVFHVELELNKINS